MVVGSDIEQIYNEVGPCIANVSFQEGFKRLNGKVVCDLHVHSIHSIVAEELQKEAAIDGHVNVNGFEPVDCLMTAQAIVKVLKLRGINVFALTDHDTVDGLEEVAKVAKENGMVMIPGVEVTVPGGGHLIVYGVTQVPEGANMGEVIANAHVMEGRTIAAHPFDSRCPFPSEFLHLVDGWELCNGGATGNITSAGNLTVTMKMHNGAGPKIATAGSDGHDIVNTGDTKLVLDMTFDPRKDWRYYLNVIMNPGTKRTIVSSKLPRLARKVPECGLAALRQVRVNGLIKSAEALLAVLMNLKKQGKGLKEHLGL